MLVGLIGKSGAGKTQIARYFAKKGFFVIDGDTVAHDALSAGSPLVEKILDAFGDVAACDGSIDRKKLGKIVFSDPEKLKLLNRLTHAFICEKFEELVAQSGNKNVLVDAAALVESGYSKKCDRVIAVVADERIRKERIMMRDGIDENTAMLRINAQREDRYYTDNADYVIDNNGGDITVKLDGILKELI